MCVSWLFNKIILYSLPKGPCITLLNMPSWSYTWALCWETARSGCTLFPRVTDVTFCRDTPVDTFLYSHSPSSPCSSVAVACGQILKNARGLKQRRSRYGSRLSAGTVLCTFYILSYSILTTTLRKRKEIPFFLIFQMGKLRHWGVTILSKVTQSIQHCDVRPRSQPLWYSSK